MWCENNKGSEETENSRKSGSLNSKALDRSSLGALDIAQGLANVHVVHSNRGQTTSMVRVATTNPGPYMPSNQGLNVPRLSLLSSQPVSRISSPSFHLSLQKMERNACIRSNTTIKPIPSQNSASVHPSEPPDESTASRAGEQKDILNAIYKKVFDTIRKIVFLIMDLRLIDSMIRKWNCQVE